MTKSDKFWRMLRTILLLGSVLAAIKLIFVDYTLDEEYQIVMAYRSISGDTLFGTMWEPHQTSAFACAILMKIFFLATGSFTGCVIYLRVCTTILQILLAVWVYRILKKITQSEYAFLIAVCYFNIVPKLIEILEFSNLQLMCFTVLVLSLTYRNKRPLWIVVAGLAQALGVLAYPTDILWFPFFLAVIFVQSKERRVRDLLLFVGSCVVCAFLWMALVLRGVSLEEFWRNFELILDFDATHELSGGQWEKWISIGINFAWEAALGIGCLLGGFVWVKLSERFGNTFVGAPLRVRLAVPTLILSEMVQLIFWIVLQEGWEEPWLPLFVAIELGALAWPFADERKRYLLPCILGSLLTLLGVVYLSDLNFFYALPHAMPGILACLLVVAFAMENTFGKREGRRTILILLASLSFLSVFGKGYTLRAGKTQTNSILGLGGMMTEGPAAGILTNYMQAYVNDCDYEDFLAVVDEDANVLIVTNMVGTGGTTPYLFGNWEISHFSIVDPTTYDEKLLTYWSFYPEKEPDVIVVDCWYGNLMEAADNWIMQYIENDFGYTRIEEGRYVRFYKKKE